MSAILPIEQKPLPPSLTDQVEACLQAGDLAGAIQCLVEASLLLSRNDAKMAATLTDLTLSTTKRPEGVSAESMMAVTTTVEELK